jgi:hypothetical protein
MPPFSRTGGEGLPLPESRSLFPYRAAAQNGAPACPFPTPSECGSVIIAHVMPHDTPQVLFPEHDHVIQAFPLQASNYSLGVRILPRTARCNDHFFDTECVHQLLKRQPIHSIPVANQEARHLAERLHDRLPRPLRRRMFRHVQGQRERRRIPVRSPLVDTRVPSRSEVIARVG